MRLKHLVFIISAFFLYPSMALSAKALSLEKAKVIQSIEDALLKHDSESLRKLMDNDFAKQYVQKKLDTYLRELNLSHVDEIETLLKAKVRPDDVDPYYEAINQENLPVCTLLNRYEVEPTSTDKEIFRAKFTLEDMALRKPASFVQKLSAATLSKTKHLEIDQEIDNCYRTLAQKLQSAKNESLKQGKPLLILVGEQHKSLNSYLYELMILHLAKDFNIDTLYTEAFSAKTYYRMSWNWSPSMAVEKVAKELNIQKKPVDLFACQQIPLGEQVQECLAIKRVPLPLDYNWVSPKGIEDRNKVMAEEIVKSSNGQDKLMIVGTGHLIGLNKLLANYYHVVPISAAKFSSSKKADTQYAQNAIDFARDAGVPFINSVHDGCVFLSADVYVEKAKAGYQRFKNQA